MEVFMFFLSKTKILILGFIFFILTFFLIYKEHSKIIQTMVFPIKNKVIVLDAGHGYPDNRSF